MVCLSPFLVKLFVILFTHTHIGRLHIKYVGMVGWCPVRPRMPGHAQRCQGPPLPHALPGLLEKNSQLVGCLTHPPAGSKGKGRGGDTRETHSELARRHAGGPVFQHETCPGSLIWTYSMLASRHLKESCGSQSCF